MVATLVLGCGLMGAASAQGYRPPVEENVSIATAEVLRVDPVYEYVRVNRPREVCREEEVRYRTRERGSNGTGGAIVGAIVGGALGNTVGKGDGRRAATVAGAIVGGAIGQDIDRRDSRHGYVYGTETRCRVTGGYVEEQQLRGYEVEYRFQGRVYVSELPYDPGNRLRVRVSVSPEI